MVFMGKKRAFKSDIREIRGMREKRKKREFQIFWKGASCGSQIKATRVPNNYQFTKILSKFQAS